MQIPHFLYPCIHGWTFTGPKSNLCTTITILHFSVFVYIFTYTSDIYIFIRVHIAVQNPFIST